MQRNVRQRGTIFLAALGVCASACTLASGILGYEVDPSIETRDLSFRFVGMKPHQTTPLDVAVVDQDQVMQARARIFLPPAPSGDYPDEVLRMEQALTPGAHKLFFYADSNGDYVIDDGEHIWIEEVPPSGAGEFTHSTTFQFFTEEDFATQNGDMVFAYPRLSGVEDDASAQCGAQHIAAFDTFELRVFLVSEDRQVGLIKSYRGTLLSADLRLNGILDAGSAYRLDVLVDGEVEASSEHTAPVEAGQRELVIEPEAWFPGALGADDCVASE